jgi:chaperone required for assembly of F1-ATPase
VSSWKAKRFWTKAEAVVCEAGFTVQLDGRAVKTPAKAALVVPSMAMAQACAAEWDAQTGTINPASMPITRYANSAIDKVAHQHAEVTEIVAAYGETDLLCYRAPDPAALIERQTAGWDPILDWVAQELGASLRVTIGISPIEQDPACMAILRGQVAGLDPFRLAAFHDLVAITGSLALGFAMARSRLDADQAFDLSRIDEHWQAELWGQDEDAAEIESGKRADLSTALQFFRYHG